MISCPRVPIAALLTCLALNSPAFATEPKPDFAIKTKAVDATVFLDARIKADPALAANCLAEGKKWAEKGRAEATQERKDSPEMFRDGGWSYERKYATRSVVANRYVSIVRDDYTNTGGAHPNLDVDTILWDNVAAKRISIRPFFIETADGGPTLQAVLKDIVISLKAEKKARDIELPPDADGNFNLEPKLLKIGAVTLAPSTEAGKSSGLTFHYPPYAVGAFVEGDYVAFVPWQTLKPYLTPDGAAIFGGIRPKGNAEEPQ